MTLFLPQLYDAMYSQQLLESMSRFSATKQKYLGKDHEIVNSNMAKFTKDLIDHIRILSIGLGLASNGS